MNANNNLSVLPFYSSIEQQNARKWWVYGRIYPLFAPSSSILPFQFAVPEGEQIDIVGNLTLFEGYINSLNQWYQTSDYTSGYVDVTSYRGKGINIVRSDYLITYAFVKNSPISGRSVEYATGSSQTRVYADVYETVPEDAVYLWVLKWDAGRQRDFTPSHIWLNKVNIFSVKIFNTKNEEVGDYTSEMRPLLSLKYVDDDVYIVYTAQTPALSLDNGQYYMTIFDGMQTWYSEVFTSVNDIEPYLKIEWWDNQDFVMDAGMIVYTNPTFKNVLYLDSDLAKPEYPFEEEGETRDGYFFPIKQISEKRYRFKFFASEYLLDVMRFIRMADNAKITYHGQVYNLDTFLITPQWEDNGDVASVEAEFDTATVAKKLPTI